MKYTNKLNLPEAYVKAVSDNMRPPVEGVYHVTELIKSVREIVLEREHYNEIEVDVSECSNTLFGTCIHHLMEVADPNHAEVKIEFDFMGIKITGRIDKIDTDNSIVDWKTCKRGKSDFEDWRIQGLIYAYGRLIKENVRTPFIKFYGLVKDASVIRGDAAIIPYIYKVNDSDYDFIDNYLRTKIKQIAEYKNNPIMCSDVEKWRKPDEWKLYAKEDSPRAMKVFDHCPTEEERNGKIVRHFEGECTKCKYYCKCAKWCNTPTNNSTPTDKNNC